jgi:hypothetical protein
MAAIEDNMMYSVHCVTNLRHAIGSHAERHFGELLNSNPQGVKAINMPIDDLRIPSLLSDLHSRATFNDQGERPIKI